MNDDQALQPFAAHTPEVAPGPHHPDAFIVACLVSAVLVLACGLIFTYLDRRDRKDDHG